MKDGNYTIYIKEKDYFLFSQSRSITKKSVHDGLDCCKAIGQTKWRDTRN